MPTAVPFTMPTSPLEMTATFAGPPVDFPTSFIVKFMKTSRTPVSINSPAKIRKTMTKPAAAAIGDPQTPSRSRYWMLMISPTENGA